MVAEGDYFASLAKTTNAILTKRKKSGMQLRTKMLNGPASQSLYQ